MLDASLPVYHFARSISFTFLHLLPATRLGLLNALAAHPQQHSTQKWICFNCPTVRHSLLTHFQEAHLQYIQQLRLFRKLVVEVTLASIATYPLNAQHSIRGVWGGRAIAWHSCRCIAWHFCLCIAYTSLKDLAKAVSKLKRT